MKLDEPIIWTGDLDDDCTAIWNSLILRAEWMDEEFWWWAVSINDGRLDEIDSSNNYDFSCIGGENARKLAEQVAINWLNQNFDPYNIVVLDLFNTPSGLVAIFDTPEKLLVGTIIKNESDSNWTVKGTSMPKMSNETNAYKELAPPRFIKECLIVPEDISKNVQIGERFALR
jgi:hypothetical protein